MSQSKDGYVDDNPVKRTGKPQGSERRDPHPIAVIELFITSVCNQSCAHCIRFKYLPNNVSFSYDEAILAADKIREMGIDTVVFGGGEPATLGYLPDYISYLADCLGLKVVLTTNGYELANNDELFRRILPKIHYLSLSLDGPDADTNDQMRSTKQETFRRWGGHFDNVLKLLGKIRQEGTPIRIKIGSVVSGLNRSNILLLGEILEEYPQIGAWKLNCMRGEFPSRSLTIDEYLPIERMILERYKDARFHVIPYDPNATVYGYLMISSENGDVFTAHETFVESEYKRVSFGNILTEPANTIIDRIVNFDRDTQTNLLKNLASRMANTFV